MSDMNLPPFFIGQRVVYVDVIDGVNNCNPKVKKGDIVTVVNTHFSKGWVISDKKIWFIEVDAHLGVMYCADDFRPVEENFQSISLSKVLETETPLIGVN